MPSLIVCTPGGALDNCYSDLTDADAWFENTLRATDWFEGNGEQQRERGLIQATQQIEACGGPKATQNADRPMFSGFPATSTQALYYPRGEDVDATGAWVVPPGILQAVYEQALHLLMNLKSAPLVDRDALQRDGVTSMSIDGMSEQYGPRREGRPMGICPEAWAALRPFRRVGYPTTTAETRQPTGPAGPREAPPRAAAGPEDDLRAVPGPRDRHARGRQGPGPDPRGLPAGIGREEG